MTTSNASKHVDPRSWEEWIQSCSIGNCRDPEVRRQLADFGRRQLGRALRRISAEVADIYCGVEAPSEKAWLMIEECLYAGTSMDSSKEGKAYKGSLIDSARNSAHLEARLALSISQVIARRILADEGFRLRQRAGADGKRTATWWRMDPMEEEPSEDVFFEPADEEELEDAVTTHAESFWDALPESNKIMLACQLFGASDIARIEAAGLIACKKSQLYNIRKDVVQTIESIEWGSGGQEARQRALLTRHLLASLRPIMASWLNRVENLKVRSFIDMDARCEDR